MIVNNTLRQNNQKFGASAEQTTRLIEKWEVEKRPDKLVWMLTKGDFPSQPKRSWADFKAYWLDKESSQTCFFREFNKKFKHFGIGRCAILTQTPVIRLDLFNRALHSAMHLLEPSAGAKESHRIAARDIYQAHSTDLEYRVKRDIPLLTSFFKANAPK